MTSSYPETDGFGFVRVGEGESLRKDNYAVTDGNWVAADRILKMLAEHDHGGGTRLADPSAAPSLTVSTSGGSLPAGQTYYYQVSYIDAYGLETAASPEVSITTPPPLGVPSGPALSVEATGGTLGAGIYRYVLAARTAGGGLTTTSDAAQVIVDTGTTNRIQITLPDLPAGAEALMIYRARPGQTQYYYWKQSTVPGDIYDDGSVAEDPTILAPAYNTSAGTNTITVTVPGGTVPTGVRMWRIYRTSSPGIYNGFNLVHQVSEGLTEDATEPRPTWVDDGSSLLRGQPRRTSATVAPPPPIAPAGIPVGGDAGQVLTKIDGTDYNTAWSTPAAGGGGVSELSFSAVAPGAFQAGKVVGYLHDPASIAPTMMMAHFVDSPTVDPDGAQVGFELKGVGAGRTSSDTPDIGPSFYVGGGQSSYRIGQTPWVTREAEDISGVSGSLIIDDVNANGGKAVRLTGSGNYLEFAFPDTFTAGDYYVLLTLRVEDSSTPVADDLRIRVRDEYDSDDLIQDDVTPRPLADSESFYTAALKFTTPGPQAPSGYTYQRDITVRITKMVANSTAYLIDSVDVLPTLESVTGFRDEPLMLRTTLLDSPNFPPPGYVEPHEPHLLAPQRVLARQGMETAVDILVYTRNGMGSGGGSASWTASSDQSWCTVPASGSSSSFTVTATVDYTGMAAGSRNVAHVTIAAAGFVSRVVEVVALIAPADPGGDANVTIRYRRVT